MRLCTSCLQDRPGVGSPPCSHLGPRGPHPVSIMVKMKEKAWRTCEIGVGNSFLTSFFKTTLLRYILHIMKFIHFRYQCTDFGNFTKCCSHHHKTVLECFHPQWDPSFPFPVISVPIPRELLFTFCLCGFSSCGHFIESKSYNLWSRVSGFFHLVSCF